MNGQTIKEKLSKSGEKMASVARRLNMTPQALQGILNSKNVSSEKMEAICNAMGWSVGYLYDEQPAFQVQRLHTPRYTESASDEPVPLYDIEATAGLNNLFNSEEHQQILGFLQIPNIPKCDGALYVKGDSMYPLLKSGDIVAYKRINCEIQSIIFGEMYLVDIDVDGDDYLAVKYIQRSDVSNDHVRLVSYNKDHAPKDIHMKHIRALALVKASVRFNTMI